MAEDLSRVCAFFDGAQIREGLDEIGVDWREVNLRDLATVLMSDQYSGAKWQGRRMGLARAYIYDSVAPEAEAAADVENWLARNGRLNDVHIRRGWLAGDPRKSRKRQKGVDVRLAVDALTLAVNGVYDVALLVTGDGDFVSLAEAIRDRGPLVVACSFRGRLSSELEEAADRIAYLPGDPTAWNWPLPSDTKPQ